MPYISSDKVSEIRNAIKSKFPGKDGWKFSIKRENLRAVVIVVLSGPANFQDKQGLNITVTRETHPYLQQIFSIANAGNYDNSDPMTDYFDVGWYVWLKVGDYDRPYTFLK